MNSFDESLDANNQCLSALDPARENSKSMQRLLRALQGATSANTEAGRRKVFERVMRATSYDNAHAIFYSGWCFHSGYGTRTDRATARWYLKESAARGCVKANFALGRIYLLGEGVARDPKKALEFFERAEARFFDLSKYLNRTCSTFQDLLLRTEAQVALLATIQIAELYMCDGSGIARDERWARLMLEDVDEYGFAEVHQLLAELPPLEISTLPEPRPKPFFEPMAQAARVNGKDVFENYDAALIHHHGTPPDLKFATRYYLVAKELKHPLAADALEAIRASVGDDLFASYSRGWNTTQRVEV